MKNIFLYIVLLSLFFFGCKSTDNVANPENSDFKGSVQVDEVLPVEVESDLQENDSLSEDNAEDEQTLEQEDIEKNIAEQGDLPLPFYDEFVPITENLDEVVLSDEFENSDEFFYGDEFVPEDTTKKLEQPTEQIVNSDIKYFDEENINSDNVLFDEQNSIAQNFEQTETLSPDEQEFSSEIFDYATESSELTFSNDLISPLELTESTEDKNSVEQIINSVNPLENEKSVIVDELLNNKTDAKSENVATNKISDKTSPENKAASENSDSEKEDLQKNINEKTSSVEKKLFEDFSIPKSDVILEDLEKDIVPSRTVYASKNQMILVSYPGNNWVYLGEIDSHALIGFKGKTFSANNTNFKLQPQKEGKTILHFYKLDAISGNYIDDYLEVVVLGEIYNPLENTVTAPEFNYEHYLMNDFSKKISENNSTSTDNEVGQEITQENFSKISPVQNVKKDIHPNNVQQNEINEQIETPITKEIAEVEVVEEEPELVFMTDFEDSENESSEDFLTKNLQEDNFENILSDIDFDDLLKQAKKAYEEKDYSKALSLINKFLETSNISVDEALFLKGQILEKPFEHRNIRDALECYKLVISAYPQSDLWDKCDERIKYIQRFYFNIR